MMRRACHNCVPVFFFLLVLFTNLAANAQQITGVWNGRIDGRKVELKMIQKGDSLTGTAYYYQSAQHYKQYRISGYFDGADNSVVWWNESVVAEKGSGLFGAGSDATLSVADFNCPGSGRMFLEGKSKKRDAPDVVTGNVALTKIETPLFADVWDYVIDNYTQGTNDPEVIDSIALVAFTPSAKNTTPAIIQRAPAMPPQPATPAVARTPPLTIEEKFKTREKIFNTEIPVSGDSIELRFYDNAEVDGDSISLFLNNNLLFEHVRLTEKAYTIKLPTAAFGDTAELVMVAENLGSIPPNTSYMVALCGGQRYEARLASTENSSAYIRLKKEGKNQK